MIRGLVREKNPENKPHLRGENMNLRAWNIYLQREWWDEEERLTGDGQGA